MSTEAVVEEPEVTIPQISPIGTPMSVVLPDMATLLSQANPPPVKGDKKPEQVSEKVEEKPKEEAKETPKEESKPDANAGKVSDKEINFKEMRAKLETTEAAEKAAREELAKLKEELESVRGKTPEIPEDVKSKLSALEELEKQLEETKRNLRTADLARDPEFQAKYTKGIQAKVGVMAQIAKEAGVSDADWSRAVSNWNEEQFGEWVEAMSPGQKMKFSAAWQGAVSLYQEQNEQLQNAEKTWESLSKQRQEQQEQARKQALTANEQLAKSVLNKVLSNEGTKEYEDLPAAAEAAVLAAARYEMSPEDVFHNVVANQVLARVTKKQATTIEDLQKKIESHEAKIKEQEEFIKSQASGVPRGDGAGGSGGAEDNTPIWQQVKVAAA